MLIDELKGNYTDPYITMTEKEILRKLEKSRTHANDGGVRDADDVIRNMRDKFGVHEVYSHEHSNRR